MAKKTRKNRKNTSGNKSLTNSLTGLATNLSGQNAFAPTINKTDTLAINERYYLVSQNRNLLSQAYVEHGIIQTLVDQPVDDGLRDCPEITTEQLDADNKKDLYSYIEKEGIIQTIKQAIIWGRLFGGSGIVVNAGQKFDTPLNLKAINENTPLDFYAADQWELNYTGYVDAQNPTYKQVDDTQYNYYGLRLNNSRVFRYEGKEAPSLIRPRLRGWGMSVVERVIRSMNQYIKNNNVIFELLDEAKVDVYKITGFNESLLSDTGTQQVENRIQAANMIKSYLNALTMDAEDDYEQKQMNLAGLSDILQQVRIGVAADLKMPMTKLFGLSASGFNAGEDDIENYNSMIESEIRSKVKPIILQVVSIICQKLFGFVPDDLNLNFAPLRILTAEQEENVKNQQFNRAVVALERNTITEEQFIQEINAGNLLNINIETES